jgi:hypothetical protein
MKSFYKHKIVELDCSGFRKEITKIVMESLVISGATKLESERFVICLRQVMGCGFMGYDMFSSMMEVNPYLMASLIDWLKCSIDEFVLRTKDRSITFSMVESSLVGIREKVAADYADYARPDGVN